MLTNDKNGADQAFYAYCDMNLQQLTALCEVVDHGLHISDAARATFRAQSSVTRQIQLLESELGFRLFVRHRNRILGITPQGEEIVGIARRMLRDAENMRRIGRNIAADEKGTFTIAATHTHARYVLPPVVSKFLQKYPQVNLSIRQGNPTQCCELVSQGRVDLAVCTDPHDVPDELVELPCYRLNRSVITPVGHPLLRLKVLTLEALAKCRLITTEEAFPGHLVVERAFSERGLKPQILLRAANADVSKAYVAMGLGIAIIANFVFDREQDIKLRRIDARHLFTSSTLMVMLRRYSYLRNYMVDFIRLFAPGLDRASVMDALFAKQPTVAPNINLPEL